MPEKIKRILKNPMFYVLLGIVVFFAIDLITKWVIVIHFNKLEGSEIELIPHFLSITLKFNTGAIFGLGDGKLWARILFIIIRLAIAIAMPVVYFLKGRNIKLRYKITLGMIYAGCLGNLVDGLFYWQNTVGFNGVVDWIEFKFFPYIFNLADSYITIAVVLIIVFVIIDEIKEIIEKNRKGAYTMTPEEYEKKLAEENRKKNGYTDKK